MNKKTLEERLAPYQKFIVTGASGFLGRAIVSKLRDLNKDVLILSSKNVDLRDQQATMDFFEERTQTKQFDVLVHCAVQGGGIGWMKDHPVSSFVDNIYINSNILVAAHKFGIEK